MVTISKSHEIEQSSKAILDNLLHLSHFITRQAIPDYHVDYFVEVVEKNNPSGIYFGIQLKGVEVLSVKEGRIKFSFKTKHLLYYSDKVKNFPVFLIIVDTINKNSYWLFIQRYLNEQIPNKNWKKQKNVNLFINIENLIDDLNEFKTEVIKANSYMKELWPSSILASARKEKEYFQNLDPRFKNISISINGDNVNYRFHSDEKLDIKFKIKDRINFKDYFENHLGEELIINKDDVDITGSELIKELVTRSEHINFKLKPHLLNVDVFWMIGDENEKFYDLLYLGGKLTYHKSYIKVVCDNNVSPLKIEITFFLDGSDKTSFNFEINLNCWINKPVQYLPFLEKLNNHFIKLNSYDSTLFRVELLGHTILSGKLQKEKYHELLNYTDKNFNLFKKLKDIDSYYNLNLLFPDFSRLRSDDICDIEELYDLITIGEHVLKDKVFTGSFTIKKEKNLLKTFSKEMDLRLIHDGRYSFLGKEINIGEYALDILNPQILLSEKELLELFNSENDYIPLKITTNENSKIFSRLLKGKVNE